MNVPGLAGLIGLENGFQAAQVPLIDVSKSGEGKRGMLMTYYGWEDGPMFYH